MHVDFNSKDQFNSKCFLSANSEADSRKLVTSAWELFYRLMNAPLRCYYFFGVKMTFSVS